MNKNKELLKIFPNNTLLASYRGSVVHNTFVPLEAINGSSDIDLFGVHFFPTKFYLGLEKEKNVYELFINEYDLVSYEFKKFISMLLNSNPNVIPMLFLKDEHYLYKDFYGRAILDNKDLFISNKIYETFYKYAEGTLAKMVVGTFSGYMGAKRKLIVEKYGFDVRQAYHCIRLLRMAHEFSQTGELKVYRDKDAQELIDIKSGKWRLEEIKEAAQELSNSIGKAQVRCDLPPKPKTEEVYKLVEEIMYDYITSNYIK